MGIWTLRTNRRSKPYSVFLETKNGLEEIAAYATVTGANNRADKERSERGFGPSPKRGHDKYLGKIIKVV